jgi:hypothetical protein
MLVIALVVIGNFSYGEEVERALRSELDCQVVRVGWLPGKGAAAPPRDADKLLDQLAEARSKLAPEGLLLGLTSRRIIDVTGYKLAGRADQDNNVAIASTGFASDNDCVDRDRDVAETALHEVGHLLGLAHCHEPGCVMSDQEGRPYRRSYGRKCRAKLFEAARSRRLCFLPEGFVCPAP